MALCAGVAVMSCAYLAGANGSVENQAKMPVQCNFNKDKKYETYKRNVL